MTTILAGCRTSKPVSHGAVVLAVIKQDSGYQMIQPIAVLVDSFFAEPETLGDSLRSEAAEDSLQTKLWKRYLPLHSIFHAVGPDIGGVHFVIDSQTTINYQTAAFGHFDPGFQLPHELLAVSDSAVIGSQVLQSAITDEGRDSLVKDFARVLGDYLMPANRLGKAKDITAWRFIGGDGKDYIVATMNAYQSDRRHTMETYTSAFFIKDDRGVIWREHALSADEGYKQTETPVGMIRLRGEAWPLIVMSIGYYESYQYRIYRSRGSAMYEMVYQGGGDGS